MESSPAEVAAPAGSSESGQSLTRSASQSDDAGYADDDTEWTQDESSSNAGIPRKRNYVQPDGAFHRNATLTPSKNDPDINAIFQACISKLDGQRVFRCTECGSEYSRPYSARRHANVHLKHSNVNCGICRIRLTGPLSLAVHLNEMHKGQTMPVSTTVVKSTQPPSTAETSRTGNSSVKDRPKKVPSSERVMKLDPPPASKKTSNLDRNSNKKAAKRVGASAVEEGRRNTIPRKAAKITEEDTVKKEEPEGVIKNEESDAVIDPPREAKAGDTPPSQERRSTRIQMRLAMEASAVEEEMNSTRPRKVTPPPIYPSNSEKMKEMMESRARRAQCAVKQQQLKEEEMDIIIEGVVAGSGGGSTRRSSRASAPAPRQSLATRDAVAAAARAMQRIDPAASAARGLASNHPAHPSLHAPPSSVMTYPRSMVGVDTAPLARSCISICSTNSSHFPRLDSVFGPQPVYQHQGVLAAPVSRRIPAPLTAALLNTIYNPAWRRPAQMGADEQRAIDSHGHAHFMLPVWMHRTETIVEKCLKALKETSMPLPPLLPLLPAPCRMLQDAECDPLSDVVGSLPRITSNSYFRSHRVETAPQPRYTFGNVGLRCHLAEKKALKIEDMNRKWWEVRTFPTFEGLCSSGPRAPLPTSARHSDTVIYTVADHWTRKLSMKCTYVTPKVKPIFSVVASQPMPSQFPPVSSYSIPAYCSTTYSSPPVTAIAPVSCTAEHQQPTQSRRPTASRRPSSSSSARSVQTVAQKKRSTEETEPEVEALVKRIKTSFSESYPGRPADRPLTLQQRLQSVQLMQHEMHPVHGYCTSDAPSGSSYSYGYIPPTPQPAKEEEITIDEDGTTFTVL